jgi:hypothetical protein
MADEHVQQNTRAPFSNIQPLVADFMYSDTGLQNSG